MSTAVVTGSSSGIGLATAGELVERGYSVVLHGNRNIRGLEAAASELKSRLVGTAQLHCIAADISCPQACERLVEFCFHRHPRLGLWVNNAGADVLTGSLRSRSFEERLSHLWQVDVLGTIRLSQLVAERMRMYSPSSDVAPADDQPASDARAQRFPNSRDNDSDSAVVPSIINLGWDQAHLGMEGEPGQLFCTVKAAVLAFTSALSLTVAPKVRVNAVSPGWIKTAWGQKSASAEWNSRAIEECQLDRWGLPSDVAETICWLASPGAGFVNGQNICVNGGRRFFKRSGLS